MVRFTNTSLLISSSLVVATQGERGRDERVKLWQVLKERDMEMEVSPPFFNYYQLLQFLVFFHFIFTFFPHEGTTIAKKKDATTNKSKKKGCGNSYSRKRCKFMKK